ncbi:putative transposase OrfB [Afipia felis]|uniref:Transposase OrfB n=1 Tax=Afipia felis TaxID=1035 RepID=A0A090MT69_AFIFE|nr:putative transposase OrfB [Afipia felis]
MTRLCLTCKKHTGYPGTIRVDQGSEVVSRDFDLWAYTNGVTLDFSRPGKPTDNAFIEAFNSKLRSECLNAHRFMSLEDAREKLEDWRKYYNEDMPHSGSAKYPRFCCTSLVTHPARHQRSKPETPASDEIMFGIRAENRNPNLKSGAFQGSRSVYD